MQTCWMSLNAFPDIAVNMKRMYDRAILLEVDNKGHFDTDIKEESLVYVLGRTTRLLYKY